MDTTLESGPAVLLEVGRFLVLSHPLASRFRLGYKVDMINAMALPKRAVRLTSFTPRGSFLVPLRGQKERFACLLREIEPQSTVAIRHRADLSTPGKELVLDLGKYFRVLCKW